MNLHQLRQFLAVAECGSFRQAGKKLNISQSAITKSIKMLETELGVELVTRGSAGSIVTVFGSELVPTAKLITKQIADATERIKNISGMGHARVAIGAGANADAVLHGTILAFKRRFPKTEIVVSAGLSAALLPRLLDGSIDMLLGPREGFEPPHSVVNEPLFSSDNFVVLSRTHPLVSATSLKDLAEVEWVLAPVFALPESCLGLALRKLGMPKPRVAIFSDSPGLTEQLVMKSNYVSLLRRSLLRASGTSSLIPLALKEGPLVEQICLFTRRSGTGSPMADRLIELLKSHIQHRRREPLAR